VPIAMQERLQKVIARAGIASRREAERLIREGRVTVNRNTVTELGTKVDSACDVIKVDGKKLTSAPANLYILLHKPPGYVSTLRDPEKRPIVVDLLGSVNTRVFPVGRLDYDAEGLLLLTNDGPLAHRLHHPRYGIRRTYEVKVKGVPSEEALEGLRKGIQLEDGMTLPARTRFLRKAINNSWIRITLCEGRNRQVKRMCAAVGHQAIKIKRVSFGTLALGTLEPGRHRYLTREEVKSLYKLVSLNT
jgi:23S rRNA pseudouridine2605 synthase